MLHLLLLLYLPAWLTCQTLLLLVKVAAWALLCRAASARPCCHACCWRLSHGCSTLCSCAGRGGACRQMAPSRPQGRLQHLLWWGGCRLVGGSEGATIRWAPPPYTFLDTPWHAGQPCTATTTCCRPPAVAVAFAAAASCSCSCCCCGRGLRSSVRVRGVEAPAELQLPLACGGAPTGGPGCLLGTSCC
jgi:hypothetical protein